MLTPYKIFPIATTMMSVDPLDTPNNLNMVPSEEVIELAARTCYDSCDKLGTNPKFIKGLIKAGHLDVLEHATVTFEIGYCVNTDEELNAISRCMFQIVERFRYMAKLLCYQDSATLNYSSLRTNPNFPQSVCFSLGANIRTWFEYVTDEDLYMDAVYQSLAPEIYDWLSIIAPNIFYDICDELSIQWNFSGPELMAFNTKNNLFNRWVKNSNKKLKLSHRHPEDGDASVSNLGFNWFCNSKYVDFLKSHHHASFYIGNVSRSYMAQHTRHRKLAHSVLSQRYTDFNKINGNFVLPEMDEDELDIVTNHLHQVKTLYETLRLSKMLKEDARCILPNATSTNMVSSAYDDGWGHYFKLRTARDAQREIRDVAVELQGAYNDIY